jgi:hypothetical protein
MKASATLRIRPPPLGYFDTSTEQESMSVHSFNTDCLTHDIIKSPVHKEVSWIFFQMWKCICLCKLSYFFILFLEYLWLHWCKYRFIMCTLCCNIIWVSSLYRPGKMHDLCPRSNSVADAPCFWNRTQAIILASACCCLSPATSHGLCWKVTNDVNRCVTVYVQSY